PDAPSRAARRGGELAQALYRRARQGGNADLLPLVVEEVVDERIEADAVVDREDAAVGSVLRRQHVAAGRVAVVDDEREQVEVREMARVGGIALERRFVVQLLRRCDVVEPQRLDAEDAGGARQRRLRLGLPS